MGVLSHWDPYRAGIANARDFLSGLGIAFAIRLLDPRLRYPREREINCATATLTMKVNQIYENTNFSFHPVFDNR